MRLTECWTFCSSGLCPWIWWIWFLWIFLSSLCLEMRKCTRPTASSHILLDSKSGNIFYEKEAGFCYGNNKYHRNIESSQTVLRIIWHAKSTTGEHGFGCESGLSSHDLRSLQPCLPTRNLLQLLPQPQKQLLQFTAVARQCSVIPLDCRKLRQCSAMLPLTF